ncbi:hypothetical protein OUZ56_010136 [Daphnia magna]|uniref:Uncharacterized protein n=1 Tax=Daphnia magna TaxID=35525 RepID=A0ABR0AI38_9CRUS|nr:hypothetical protein OUZ56_010136 [Daphnia magna]
MIFHEGPLCLSLNPSELDTCEEIPESEGSEVNVIQVFAVKTEDSIHTIDDSVRKYLRLEIRDKCQSKDGRLQPNRWGVNDRRNVDGINTVH